MDSFSVWLEEYELREGIVGSSLQSIGRFVANKWLNLEKRYSRKGALLMAVGMVLAFPIPFSTPAIIAAAEGIRKLRNWSKDNLTPEDIEKIEQQRV